MKQGDEARKVWQKATEDYLAGTIDGKTWKKILAENPAGGKAFNLFVSLASIAFIIFAFGGCIYLVSRGQSSGSDSLPYRGCWNNYTKSYYQPSFGQQCGYGKQY